MKGKLLIVEDNRMMAQILKFNFEAAGFNVQLAYTVRQAIQDLGERPFDLVMTDYSLPDGTGEMVCRHVRDSAVNASVPIVLCSAKGYEVDQIQLQAEFGISGFIYKPFSIPDVIQIVKDLTTNQVRVTA